ncbi:hypothetical protein ACJX0J_039236, partial [Zea mays]
LTSLVETIQFSGILAKKSIILNVRTNRFVFKVVFTSPSLLLMNWRVALVQKKQELGKFLLDVDYSCRCGMIRVSFLGFEILIEYFFAFKLVVFRLPLFWVTLPLSYFIADNHKCWYMLLYFKALGLGAHRLYFISFYQKC